MSDSQRNLSQSASFRFDPNTPGVLEDNHRSVSPRVKGGGFSKSMRFDSSLNSNSPGPIYKVPSLLHTSHVHTPLYRTDVSPTLSRRPPTTVLRASPSRDRSAWLLGANRDGLVTYKEVSELNGPGQYHPKHGASSKELLDPRTAFDKSGRFQLASTLDLDADRRGMYAPGPKYNTREINTHRHAPSYSFRSESKSGRMGRSEFLKTNIRDGYLYQTDVSTAGCTSLSSNDVDLSSTLSDIPRAPRAAVTKATRFGQYQKNIYISKRHAKDNIGVHSPGPVYFPRMHEIGRLSTKMSAAPSKWIP